MSSIHHLSEEVAHLCHWCLTPKMDKINYKLSSGKTATVITVNIPGDNLHLCHLKNTNSHLINCWYKKMYNYNLMKGLFHERIYVYSANLYRIIWLHEKQNWEFAKESALNRVSWKHVLVFVVSPWFLTLLEYVQQRQCQILCWSQTHMKLHK